MTTNVLYDANRACRACSMRDECEGPVPAEGPMNAEVALIGEAPGRNEDRTGLPFRGAAGKFLDSLLRSQDIDREEIWVSNMSKCRPKGNRTPTPEEARFCASRWLDVELNMVKPRVIGLLGDVAISYFLGEGTVYERHGKPLLQQKTIGYGSNLEVEDTWLLPMYHPAAGLYDKGEGRLAQIMEDFKVLGELVRGEWKPVVDEYPSPQYLEEEVSTQYNLHRVWAVDTETVDGKLWSVQASGSPGVAGFFKGPPVAFPHQVIVHNYMFDAKFIDLPPNTRDTQIMAYLLGLPQSLKELAKRLCGMEMQSYTEMTREYGKEKAMKYLEDAVNPTMMLNPEFINSSSPVSFSWEGVTERILEMLHMPILLNHPYYRMVYLSQLPSSHRRLSGLGVLGRSES